MVTDTANNLIPGDRVRIGKGHVPHGTEVEESLSTMGEVSPRVVVVSNRVPSINRGIIPAGGLVTAVKPVLESRGGLWFGWSGKTTSRRRTRTVHRQTLEPIELVTLDLFENEYNLYYIGFSSRTLWSLLHSFLDRVEIRRDTYRAYRRVNRGFAQALYPLLREDDVVWVQDYHLFHLGSELRDLGWQGRIGFFLHVPFPPATVFSLLPWAREILESLTQYDLVGVQTERYLHDLEDSFQWELGSQAVSGVLRYGDRQLRVGAYPVGIDPAVFREWALTPSHKHVGPSEQRIVLGVDRLDYTKGVPLRLRAFERLLARYPSLKGRVSYVQVSSPSRTRMPEYVLEKQLVEQIVGEINGRYSNSDWIPIRYLYRTYPQYRLAEFYRDADVCLVTPLRDGMNLVAKEFVASQGKDPGVLVLSKFCGASEMLKGAIEVNPYDVTGTAEALREALTMPLAERRTRWDSMADAVNEYTAQWWSNTFLTDLVAPLP